MQGFDGEEFLKCLKHLISIEREWVPYSNKCSLYIRPTLIATQVRLAVIALRAFIFLVSKLKLLRKMEEEPVNHELDVFLPHIFTGKYFITTIEPSNCMINQVPMQPSRFSYWLHVLSLDVHAAQRGGGVLPIMAYMGRLHPKGVPFSGFRYIKG